MLATGRMQKNVLKDGGEQKELNIAAKKVKKGRGESKEYSKRPKVRKG